jgi:hypothetical protein
MDYFTYFQIGISIVFAIVFVYFISRIFSISVNRYFVGLIVATVIINAFTTFVKNIVFAAEEDTSPSTSGKARADILKDMTTQFELPTRPWSGKANYRTFDRGSAGCPVIAL